MKVLNKISEIVGTAVSWLTTALVILICTDVLFRYVFKFSKTWIIDLEWHLFSVIFLLGAAYTLQADKHVRVDVFYHKFSDKKKAWVNLIGTLFLLIPWSTLLIVKSYSYAINSWVIREGAADPGGLPGRYIIKFVILLAFVFLLIQAISELIKNGKTIMR